MSKPDFAYDSTAIIDSLGAAKASDYLDLASKTRLRAKTVLIYGYTLVGLSAMMLFLLVMSLTDLDSAARGQTLCRSEIAIHALRVRVIRRDAAR